MASSNISTLAAMCIEIFNSSGDSLVDNFVLSYNLYIGFCLVVCLVAAIPLLQKLCRCGGLTLSNHIDVSLSVQIPFLPNFDLLLFLAPLFLALSNAFLLLVRVNDVRARPFFYTSPLQFERASFSSKMFTAHFVVAPISTLFSSLLRMIFMFRIVLLCQKIGTILQRACLVFFFSNFQSSISMTVSVRHLPLQVKRNSTG
jgi:hypothetical protein